MIQLSWRTEHGALLILEQLLGMLSTKTQTNNPQEKTLAWSGHDVAHFDAPKSPFFLSRCDQNAFASEDVGGSIRTAYLIVLGRSAGGLDGEAGL